MGAFSGLKDAKRGFSSNPLREGKYVVRIDECVFFDAPQSGETWKNTLTILAVIEGMHRVGEVVNTFFKTKHGKPIFQQNLKSFMASVLDVEDEQIDEAAAMKAVEAGSPMIGLVTVVTGRTRVSKTTVDEKTGQKVMYVVPSWSKSLTDAEIVEAIGADGMARFFPNGL